MKGKMRTRLIKTDIIEDGWYVSLQLDEKLFFLHLLITPRSEMSGVYFYPDRNMLIDCPGISSERLQIIKAKFEKEDRVYFKDGWVFIVNFLRNNNFNGAVHRVGVGKQINDLQKRNYDIYKYFLDRSLFTSLYEYFGPDFFDKKTKEMKK